MSYDGLQVQKERLEILVDNNEFKIRGYLFELEALQKEESALEEQLEIYLENNIHQKKANICSIQEYAHTLLLISDSRHSLNFITTKIESIEESLEQERFMLESAQAALSKVNAALSKYGKLLRLPQHDDRRGSRKNQQ